MTKARRISSDERAKWRPKLLGLFSILVGKSPCESMSQDVTSSCFYFCGEGFDTSRII